jgi:hypothetical protein
LQEHISNYETEMHAKLEHEVLKLRAQLEEQETKIKSAKEQLMREKTKRRGAQVEREAWKEKYLKQQAVGGPTAESVKQEEET